MTKIQQRNLIIGLIIIIAILYIVLSVNRWSQHRQDTAAKIATRQAITEATIEAR